MYEAANAAGRHLQAVVAVGLAAAVVAVASWEWKHQARTDRLVVVIAYAYGAVGLVDLVLETQLSSANPETMLSILILVAVMYVATRPNRSRTSIVLLSGWIAFYSVAVVLITDIGATQAMGMVAVGVVGQTLAIWMTDRLIGNLDAVSRREAKQATIQRALADCSHALLSSGSEHPLDDALEALLNATDADYAYIDVNHVAGDRVDWEIVAEAATDAYPVQDSSFMSGDYSHLQHVVAHMESGRPFELITSELPSPIREKYEREQIKAELFAPIRIGERWVGTIGYTDHLREGFWAEMEVEALMRAAEMVAAYWDREAAREGLMELAKAKDRFIATVSHELRTPLTAVVGFAAEMVKGFESFSGDDLRELASYIHEQSIEVSQLVEDLLTSERAASGNLTVRPTAFSVRSACQDVVDSVMGERGVEIVGDDVVAHADVLRTRQIVRNLITNATRYGGDTIQIETSASSSMANVIVRDNGSGVNGVDPERIFDAYYRAPGGETAPDSVGLGLSVARQLAQLMDGDLRYRRREGWTCFDLVHPLAGHTGIRHTEVGAMQESAPV